MAFYEAFVWVEEQPVEIKKQVIIYNYLLLQTSSFRLLHKPVQILRAWKFLELEAPEGTSSFQTIILNQEVSKKHFSKVVLFRKLPVPSEAGSSFQTETGNFRR